MRPGAEAQHYDCLATQLPQQPAATTALGFYIVGCSSNGLAGPTLNGRLPDVSQQLSSTLAVASQAGERFWAPGALRSQSTQGKVQLQTTSPSRVLQAVGGYGCLDLGLATSFGLE
jgi:hypothetical protein